MERIHEGYEYKDFEMPSSIEKKTICAKTGKLASSEACSAYTEYFAPGTAPTQSCPGHVVEKPETDNNSGTTTPPSDNSSDSSGNTSGGDSSSNSGSNSDSETPPTPPTP